MNGKWEIKSNYMAWINGKKKYNIMYIIYQNIWIFENLFGFKVKDFLSQQILWVFGQKKESFVNYIFFG